MTIRGVAGSMAAIAGFGAAAGSLVATSSGTEGARPLEVAGVGVAAGAILLLGGGGIARMAERTLRPQLAATGRVAALTGAATLAGTVAGTVGAHLASRVSVHRDTRQSSERLESARTTEQVLEGDLGDARAAEEAPADTEAAERADALVRELDPRVTERNVTDGRIDLVGAPIAAAARAVFDRYEYHDVVTYADHQRTIDGRTLSIAPLVEHVVGIDGGDGENENTPGVELDAVEQRLRDVDGRGPVDGAIDGIEAASWYDGPDAVGEIDISWDYAGMLADIGSTERTDDEQQVWTIGAFHERAPILALVGVEDVADARRYAEAMAESQQIGAVAVIQMPEDSPVRFGLARVQVDGYAADSYDYPGEDDPSLRGLLDERVVSVVDDDGNVFDEAQLH